MPGGIVVALGAIGAHVGAIGGGIVPGDMLKIMGTSTCDMIVPSGGRLGGRAIRGICGQVDGSILPGYEGLEAGQSAFGDAQGIARAATFRAGLLSRLSEKAAAHVARVLAVGGVARKSPYVMGGVADAMGAGVERVYEPDPARQAYCDGRYRRYLAFGAFAEDLAVFKGAFS